MFADGYHSHKHAFDRHQQSTLMAGIHRHAMRTYFSMNHILAGGVHASIDCWHVSCSKMYARLQEIYLNQLLEKENEYYCN